MPLMLYNIIHQFLYDHSLRNAASKHRICSVCPRLKGGWGKTEKSRNIVNFSHGPRVSIIVSPTLCFSWNISILRFSFLVFRWNSPATVFVKLLRLKYQPVTYKVKNNDELHYSCTVLRVIEPDIVFSTNSVVFRKLFTDEFIGIFFIGTSTKCCYLAHPLQAR